MAAAGAPVRVPVAVALRVLGLSRQGDYQWLKAPVSDRDWDDAHVIDVLYDLHADDDTLGYRFLTYELESEHGWECQPDLGPVCHSDSGPPGVRSAGVARW